MQERARIARELHDVVAHAIGVMVVQAGAARTIVDRDPTAAKAAIEQVERTGRDGLVEMRRLIGVLTSDGAGDRAPQPGLGALDELVATMRSTGLAVEVVRAGEERPLAAGPDLTAYRVIQEALTNVLKHAGPAHARVTLGYEDARLVIEVEDDGIGPSANDDPGHGLVGMRERIGLYGGVLETGVRRGGGFAVHAEIPTRTGRIVVTIRVVIADDQALMRGGFRMILDAEEDIQVVGEAIDGADAIRAFARERPDVVVMDVRMPSMDGIEATRRITAKDGTAKVLILTTFDLDEYVYDALRAGASGFLLKDRPPEELVAAVRIVAAGDALLSPSITRRLIGEFASRPQPPPTPAGLDDLTEREREVLLLMAQGASNAEIARRLYVAETTVKTHVAHVLRKLDLRDRAQAVVLAYESRPRPARVLNPLLRLPDEGQNGPVGGRRPASLLPSVVIARITTGRSDRCRP